MDELNGDGAGASNPPVVATTVVTTADAFATAKAPTPDETGAANEERPLDIRAILEASWARNEPGYRRLAE